MKFCFYTFNTCNYTINISAALHFSCNSATHLRLSATHFLRHTTNYFTHKTLSSKNLSVPLRKHINSKYKTILGYTRKHLLTKRNTSQPATKRPKGNRAHPGAARGKYIMATMPSRVTAPSCKQRSLQFSTYHHISRCTS